MMSNQINRHPNLKLQNCLIFKQDANKKDSKFKDTVQITNPLKPLYFIMRIVSVDPSETSLYLRKVRGVLLTVFICYASYWSIVGRFKYVYTHIISIIKIIDLSGLFATGSVCIFNILSCSLSSPTKTDKSKMNCTLIDNLLGVDKFRLNSVNKKWIVKTVCLVLLYWVVMCCFDFYTWSKSLDFDHSTKYIINYLLHFINTLVVCHFIAHLHILWSKFYILNEHLEMYSQNICTMFEDRYSTKGSNEDSEFTSMLLNQETYSKLSKDCFVVDKHRVDKLMKVYMMSCDMADSCNSYFAVQMLLAAVSSVISVLRSLRITVMFGEALDGAERSESMILPMVTTINESIFITFILFLIILSCVFTMTEAKRTSFILDMILYNICSDASEETQKLEAWSQLMVRRSPKFTACQMFPIDYQLLVSITGTVMTYFIIIVQIKE